jgi:dTDP-4-amino-4,6-dideoxygalactose transaminase
LARWPRLLQLRRAVFDDYRRALAALSDVSLQAGLESPPSTLCVRLPADAAAVAEGLAADAIETRRWYLPPLNRHPAFRHLPMAGLGELPVTQSLAERLLGLPFHTRLSSDDVARVVRSLSNLLGGQGAARACGPMAAP